MRSIPLAIAIAVAIAFPAAVALEAPSPLATERMIVGFHEMPDLREGDAYQGGRVVAVDADLRFAVVEAADAVVFEARVALDENARYVERDAPDYAQLSFVPNDARYGEAGHYGSKIIGAEAAWDKTRGSTAIKVGMLDTGIRRTHEDVAGGRVLQGYDFYNNDNNPNDEGGLCSYHGSHTTGTAGATINNAKGIAGISQHTILPVKAFGGFFCGGSTTALVNGLKYIADQGSHVSSNSWGSSSNSAAINDALTYAHNKGTIHVAAAGNDGSCTNCVGYPWKVNPTKAIIVSASDSKDAFASFSSEGPEVDVAAPGVGILSLSGSSDTAYQTLDGTSMACPHVAGVAALVKALNPSFTFSQVEGRLTSTAKDLGTAGRDDRFGYGRVQANLAVY